MVLHRSSKECMQPEMFEKYANLYLLYSSV
jgi:hypothetical protein